MKIPETNTNVGAYYGSDENGQWQGNGVIVGGQGVGSGDAGAYQIAATHVPPGSYVMAGAYYGGPQFGAPPAPPHDAFADYMWMENEEEFDKQVMQQLEEEALMEQCIEAMLEDEQRERNRPSNGHQQPHGSAARRVSSEQVSRSTLNPLAAEFVPTFARVSINTLESKNSVPEASAPARDEDKSPPADSALSEEPQPDPEPNLDKKEEKKPKEDKQKSVKDTKKTEAKRPSKADVKKSKPQVVKSEPKISSSPASTTKKEVAKKELKTSKSNDVVPAERDASPVTSSPSVAVTSPPSVASVTSSPSTAVTSSPAAVTPAPSVTSTPSVSSVTAPVSLPSKAAPEPVAVSEEPAPGAFKPINYAAAARANKPKKASTPPVQEKPIPPPHKTERPVVAVKSLDKLEKTAAKTEKAAPKDKRPSEKTAVKTTEKPRKNSAK